MHGDEQGDLHVVGADGQEINQALTAAGIFPGAIKPERLSLEEWFLSLTQTGQH